MAGNRPDYTVTVFDKNNPDYKGQIGVAWLDNANGSVSIKLNRCTVLNEHDGLIVKLWPIDYSRQRQAPSTPQRQPQTGGGGDTPPNQNENSDDDIPF